MSADRWALETARANTYSAGIILKEEADEKRTEYFAPRFRSPKDSAWVFDKRDFGFSKFDVHVCGLKVLKDGNAFQCEADRGSSVVCSSVAATIGAAAVILSMTVHTTNTVAAVTVNQTFS